MSDEISFGVPYTTHRVKNTLLMYDIRGYNESTYNKYGWAYVCGALD